MSTRPRRSAVKQYEEVESDIDMSEDERALSREVEAAEENDSENGSENDSESSESDWDKPPKKKQRLVAKSVKSEIKNEPVCEFEGALSLLPSQNLDLVAEIFSRLDLATLVNIAHLNKDFQNLLAKTSTGNSIFRAARSAIGLNILKGMSEIHFASLCFGSTCFECLGFIKSTVLFDAINRARCCSDCSPIDYAGWSKSDVCKTLQDLKDSTHLHRYSEQCIPHRLGDWWFCKPFCIIDCERVSLLDAWEAASEELYKVKSDALIERTSSTSARLSREERAALEVAVDGVVSAYAEERAKSLSKSYEKLKNVRASVGMYYRILYIEAHERDREVKKGERVLIEKRIKDLESRVLAEELCDAEDLEHDLWQYDSKVVGIVTQIDDEEWDRIQSQLLDLFKRIEKSRSNKVVRQATNSRKSQIYSYYTAYKASRREDFEEAGIEFHPFPSFDEFSQFRAVKPIWSKKGVDMEEAFEKEEEAIDNDFIEFRDEIKTEAILQILNTEELPLPLADYDEEFFDRFTSQFIRICEARVRKMIGPRRSGKLERTCTGTYSYQESLLHHTIHTDSWRYAKKLTSRNRYFHPFQINQAAIARKILKAGGLAETASMDQVRALDETGKFLSVSEMKRFKNAALNESNFFTASELLDRLGNLEEGKPIPLIRFYLNNRIPSE